MLEDIARFALNDSTLSAEWKNLRHEFRAVLDQLPPGWIEANRNVTGDVGTMLSTPAEGERKNLLDVAIAAGKRLTESLRVIEETIKTVDAHLAPKIENLRYRAYDLAAKVQSQMGTGRGCQWHICVLLTESLCLKPWEEVLHAAIDGGADCIQVREKYLTDMQLIDRVQRVVMIAKPAGVSVIVNDRPDIALITGADGVHLGQTDLPIAEVRRLAGRNLIIGSSTHDLSEAKAAVEAGADYCGVGAMFPTAEKPDRIPIGPGYLQDFIDRCPQMPHLAIGGITLANIQELIRVNVQGIAVSSAVCHAEDPEEVVAQLRRAITSTECSTVS